AIQDIMPKVEDSNFMSDIRTQFQQYSDIRVQAEARLLSIGAKPEPVGMMKKAGMKMATEMNTVLSNDTAHLAELMIKGSNMGITNMTKVMNNYTDPDPEVSTLADRLIQTEQQNIERLKVYLH
ncbi:MAG: hypothetical protein IJG63_02350, partial [Oscillospiraceae bacterium]|nr:hypothetical protein [Oscillospiraceae bacterium]